MIKLSTLTVLPQNETRTIRCEVAGAQYFLWNFPNGDFLQTTVPTVSPKPYQIPMLIFPGLGTIASKQEAKQSCFHDFMEAMSFCFGAS